MMQWYGAKIGYRCIQQVVVVNLFHRMTGKRHPRSAVGSCSSMSSDASSTTSDSGLSLSGDGSNGTESGRGSSGCAGRYLLCPFSLSVTVLEKFIRSKYNLHSTAKVSIETELNLLK